MQVYVSVYLAWQQEKGAPLGGRFVALYLIRGVGGKYIDWLILALGTEKYKEAVGKKRVGSQKNETTKQLLLFGMHANADTTRIVIVHFFFLYKRPLPPPPNINQRCCYRLLSGSDESTVQIDVATAPEGQPRILHSGGSTGG